MAALPSLFVYKMNGEVEVDENCIGGRERGYKGRGKGSKRLVTIGIERAGQGISIVHARVISNAGVKQLKPFFEIISQNKTT